LKPALKALYFLAMVAAIVFTFKVPGAAGFMNPDLARVIFYHLPCAIGSSCFLIAAPIYAWFSLSKHKPVWDVRAVAAMEIAWTLGVLTLITGSLFSKVQWGSWWNWDPRQTSFLICMLIVTGYFTLRLAFGDASRRAAHSAAYILASVIPVMFLIFVYPRLPQVTTLHPDVLRDGGFDTNYTVGFFSMFALVMIACGWAFRMRVKAGVLEYESEELDVRMADRDRAPASGVVRPVPVPPER